MRQHPSPLAAWHEAEDAAAQAEQQLFDQTLAASNAESLPTRAEVDRVRALRARAGVLMLEAAAARARIRRPHVLRSAVWLAPAAAMVIAWLWLARPEAAQCAAACVDWGYYVREACLFGVAASLAAFGLAFATDHVFGGYARDMKRWEAGLPPAD